MIQPNFAWTFAIEDRSTVRFVREQFLPNLKAELDELKYLESIYRTTGYDTTLRPQIEQTQARIEAAERRLELVTQL